MKRTSIFGFFFFLFLFPQIPSLAATQDTSFCDKIFVKNLRKAFNSIESMEFEPARQLRTLATNSPISSDDVIYDPDGMNPWLKGTLTLTDLFIKTTVAWFLSDAAGLFADSHRGSAGYVCLLIPVFVASMMALLPDPDFMPIASASYAFYKDMTKSKVSLPTKAFSLLYKSVSLAPALFSTFAFVPLFASQLQTKCLAEEPFTNLMANFCSIRLCLSIGQRAISSLEQSEGFLGRKIMISLGEKAGYAIVLPLFYLATRGFQSWFYDCEHSTPSPATDPHAFTAFNEKVNVARDTLIFIAGSAVWPWAARKGRAWGEFIYDAWGERRDPWMIGTLAISTTLGGLIGGMGGEYIVNHILPTLGSLATTNQLMSAIPPLSALGIPTALQSTVKDKLSSLFGAALAAHGTDVKATPLIYFPSVIAGMSVGGAMIQESFEWGLALFHPDEERRKEYAGQQAKKQLQRRQVLPLSTHPISSNRGRATRVDSMRQSSVNVVNPLYAQPPV